MNPSPNHVLAIASVSLGMLVALPAHGASLTQVSRATWGATSSTPSYLEMYIYVPDKRATNPPILVAAHSCGSNANGYYGGLPGIKGGADTNGFIIIYPDNPGRNCWDSGSDKSLTHDGGSDTLAIVQMVKYALTKYNGDPTRVYAMGGSSGAMLTQALMAVYPDVFRAGSARAGVPAGCWHEGYRDSDQWSDSCAAGSVNKTAEQWGTLVRAMYPSYTGHRPRLQIFHGTNDETIKYPNFNEAIEEWTNVLGLSATPTSTKPEQTNISKYDRKIWTNDCGSTVFEAWSAPGGTHSMKYEETEILKFFGLNTIGPDPEGNCGNTGDAGAGGASSTGGATAAGGTTTGGSAAAAGGAGMGGKATSAGGAIATGGRSSSSANGGTSAVGTDGSKPTSGGALGSGGAAPTGGAKTTGGAKATRGARSSGGAQTSSGGSDATGGAATGGTHDAETGGSSSTGATGIAASGGSSAPTTGGIASIGGTNTAPSNTQVTDTNEGSCSCRAAGIRSRAPVGASALISLLGVALVTRRRRKS